MFISKSTKITKVARTLNIPVKINSMINGQILSKTKTPIDIDMLPNR